MIKQHPERLAQLSVTNKKVLASKISHPRIKQAILRQQDKVRTYCDHCDHTDRCK